MSRVTFLDKTSNPTLRAVYFEDAAALVGIVIAVSGLALHQITHQPVWDAIGSILVGLLLGFVAIYLLRRNMAFLVGQIADPRVHEKVLGWLRERPEVESVNTLHLEYVGPGKIFLVGSVDLVGRRHREPGGRGAAAPGGGARGSVPTSPGRCSRWPRRGAHRGRRAR